MLVIKLDGEISKASTQVAQLHTEVRDISAANCILEGRLSDLSEDLATAERAATAEKLLNLEVVNHSNDTEGKVSVLTGALKDKELEILKISEDMNNLSNAFSLKSAEVEKGILLHQIAVFAFDEDAKKMELKMRKCEEDICVKDLSFSFVQKEAMEEKEQYILAQNALREEIVRYQVIIATLEKEIDTCNLSLTQSLSDNKVLLDDKIVVENIKNGMSLSLTESEAACAALLEVKETLFLKINMESNKVVRTVEDLMKMTAIVQEHEASINDLKAINKSYEVTITSLHEEIDRKDKDGLLAAGESLELKKELVNLSDEVVCTAEKLEIIVNEKGRLKVELNGSIEEFRKMKALHLELEKLVGKQKGEIASLVGDLTDHRMKSTITSKESQRRNYELSSKNDQLDEIMEARSKLNIQLEMQLAESVRLKLI